MKWIRFFQHVIQEDCYKFRRYPQNSFELIIDIGAATGMFSVMARVLHPRATMVAVEPDKIPYEHLKKNVLDLKVNIEHVALGDGEKRYRLLKDRIGRTMFSPTPTGDYEIGSVRLSDIFYKYGGNLTKRYYIKIDCEGGEQWLVNHPPTDEVLYNASAIGMKLHFPSEHPDSPRWYNEPWAAPWEYYHDWWTKLFTNHEVIYERSSRKTGYGHLLITNSNFEV